MIAKARMMGLLGVRMYEMHNVSKYQSVTDRQTDRQYRDDMTWFHAVNQLQRTSITLNRFLPQSVVGDQTM